MHVLYCITGVPRLTDGVSHELPVRSVLGIMQAGGLPYPETMFLGTYVARAVDL